MSLPVLAFDLDDTLWSTAAALKRAHDAMVAAAPTLAAEKQSTSSIKEEMQATMAAHPERAHDFTFVRQETLLRLLGGDTEAAEAAWAAWFAQRNNPQFYPGCIDALRELRRAGYRLCAISDGNSKPMEIAELGGLLEFAVSAAEAGAAKPDSRPFLLAAEKAGVHPSTMVYFGDNYGKDVLGAKNAGMRAVWVRTPPPQEQEQEFILGTTEGPIAESVADAELKSVADLPALMPDLLQSFL